MKHAQHSKQLQKAIDQTAKRLPGFAVVEISDEREDGNNCFLYFAPGFHWCACHSVSGETIADIIDDLKLVERCDCSDCASQIRGGGKQ